QRLVVLRHPPAWIEEERGALEIGRRAETQQDLLAQREHAAEIGVGLGPARRDDDARQTLRMLERQYLGNGAAGRMSDDMRPLAPESVHQLDDALRHAGTRLCHAG